MFCPNGHCLCRTLQNLSVKTWNDLQDAEQYNSPMYEETITQNLSLELNKQHASQTKVHMFKKHQETLNGSDWIWLFYDKARRKEFRVIVQAKRLYPSGRYDAFKIEQPDKMLRYAGMVNAVPVYALYNYPKARRSIYPPQKPIWMGYIRGLDHARDYGVSLVHAKLVAALGIDGKNARKMLEHAIPWWLPACNCGLLKMPNNSLKQFAGNFSLLLSYFERFAGFQEIAEMSRATNSWLNGDGGSMDDLENEFLNADVIGDARDDMNGFRPSFVMATDVSVRE